MKILKHSQLKTAIKYSISVDKDYWKELQERKLKQLVKSVKLPGFRAGHVPPNVARSRISDSDVINASLKEAVDHNYRLLLDDSTFKKEELLEDALSIDIAKIEKDILEIDYVFEKYPTVTLPDYKKIDLHQEKVQATEDEVNAEISRLIKRDVMLVPKESNVVEKGDMVNFDFEGSVDGKKFPGGEAKGYELEIGSHQFIPGFEEQMVGHKRGANADIKVKFPNDYHATDMAGKDASFKIKINDIKTITKPTLDDKYITGLNIPNVKTETELRNSISESIRNYKQHQNRQGAIKIISEYISNNTTISYWPESLIKSEAKRINQETEKTAKESNASLDDYVIDTLRYKNREAYDNQVLDIAKKNLTVVMGLEKIIEELKLEVTNAELQKHLAEMSKAYNLKIEDIKERVKDNYDGIKTFILQEKVFDELIKLNTK